MGLQVRVKHALGEQLVELPDRLADNPLLVGRSKDADIKIPSVAVAARHAALFLHDGRWVTQDLSKGATYVNGKPISGPTQLSIGDVLQLGNDATPATIEIDPAGAGTGRTGEAALMSERAVAPRPRSVSVPRVAASAAQTPPKVAGIAPPRAAPPQIVRSAPAAPPIATDDAWNEAPQPAAADDPFADWQPNYSAAQSADATITRRRRKPASMSPVAIAVGIIICAGIVGSTYWAVRSETHHTPASPQKGDGALTSAARGTGNIFTGAEKADPAPATPVAEQAKENPSNAVPAPKPPANAVQTSSVSPPSTPSPATPSTSGPHNPEATASDDDPKKDDKVWNDVLGATISPDIGQSILKFDDYRRQHPGVGTKELDEFTEQAMDRLWWKRIIQLCARRDKDKVNLKAKDKELKEQPEGAFRKTLMDERKVIQDDLDHTQERLASDMGYTNAEAPDQDNKETMAHLTSERDAGKYGAWKISTIKYIRNTHGATPWDGEG